MYLPILALLSLFVPYTFANGCHQGKDNIGCPTVLSNDVFTDAIAQFCNNHFILPNQPPLTLPINVGTSWPGLVYSLPIYEDNWGTQVEFWGKYHRMNLTGVVNILMCPSSANFRVDRTSNGDPYTLTYPLCISLLGQAYTGNNTDDGNYGSDCRYTEGTSFGGWGNTDFGTVFAEAICPPGVHCVPWDIRPLGC